MAFPNKGTWLNHRWRFGDRQLEPQADPAFARVLLERYRPVDPGQVALRDAMLGFIDRFPWDAHLRSRLEGHLTASALVVDSAFEQVLLLHHRKLGKWLQPGGHCDGDANLPAVALRECVEETGIEGLEVDPRIIDLDIHAIPAREEVPTHLHFDTRFLVVAPAGAVPQQNHESEALRFWPRHEALEVAGDDSLRRLIHWLG